MKKALTTKAFTLFTLLFVLIAAFSFATFSETKKVCTTATNKCSPATPLKKGSEMLWDGFSRRFFTIISIR